jgi:ABC-type siderophore export system fused ATPase/permease subunit
LSAFQASGIILLLFTVGAAANAGRAMLIKISGLFPLCMSCVDLPNVAAFFVGQRIVARLRERTYEAALRQEIEFVEKGEGDVVSRLSVDSSIVGERYGVPRKIGAFIGHCFYALVSLKTYRMV